MVPSAWSGRVLKSITADGGTVDFKTEPVKGIQYRLFSTTAAEAHVVVSYE